MKFIRESEDDVLVHCNEGKSRGPSIALLSLVQSGTITGTVAEIFKKFEGFYPKNTARETESTSIPEIESIRWLMEMGDGDFTLTQDRLLQ